MRYGYPVDRLQYTLVGSWSFVCFSIISAALIMESYMHAWAENYMARSLAGLY
jgi:hypothetical protein